MVVKFQFYHLYKCPWDVVTSIHVSKYPTNKEPNVIGAEIIEKTKDRGELSYLKYIVTCLNVLPSFLRKVEALNIEAVQYEEECWIYKDRRIMKVKSRNLTLSQFTEMTETSVFRQCSRDPSWTEIEQEGQIVVKGLGPANWLIERFIQKFFERGIKKNVKLMEELIEERYGLQFPKPSS
ncbi:PRELI domain-containing protein 2-like [Artemia franciscana]|uniref:PRELI/MSF1 domain-containing protein n=1 Tax=Artemia franciscana TaxID=6661 RepID=A0AA88LIT2_ARTSF|nr:hypothetical protein QYM36_001879 [Artemia franciscana]